MQDEYCEGCQQTQGVQHYVLCAECADKAACYDITLRDRRFLYRGVKAMQSPLKDAQAELQKLYANASPVLADKLAPVLMNISVCVGRVDVMVDDCAPQQEQEQKGEQK